MEGRAAEMAAVTQGGHLSMPPLGVGGFSKPRPLERRGLENQANEKRGAKNYR